jgi:lipopolysaccharide transport system ATP-binding protein
MIRLQNVCKRYELRQLRHRSQGGTLLHSLLNLHRKSEYWALRDVTLDIPPGDTVALMGVNGSGKSTLLKIIAGVTRATSGLVEVPGRAGGMIELGAGFHNDLTGMENIFVHGSLLGLSRQQIRERLDSILDFAELGRFIHSPVRHYSWGMYLRLGFALAVHTDPDVLLVDEVIAVGDGYFQWKCMRKIAEMRDEGKTILFVSHIPDLAEAVCKHAAWIQDGQIKAFGLATDVARQYDQFLRGRMLDGGPLPSAPELAALVPHVRVGSGDAVIRDVKLLNSKGAPRRSFASGERVSVEFTADAARALNGVGVAMSIERGDQSITLVHSTERGKVFDLPKGESRLQLTFPEMCLHEGSYVLSLSLYDVKDLRNLYDCHLKIYSFTITENSDFGYSTRFLVMPAKLNYQTAGPA